eukprot:12672949-Prorocentrum_lima.AAC.1
MLRVPLLDEGDGDALVLESTPSVISVSERCLGHGYSFFGLLGQSARTLNHLQARSWSWT